MRPIKHQISNNQTLELIVYQNIDLLLYHSKADRLQPQQHHLQEYRQERGLILQIS